jgi:putative PEP-CTERM system histidine kinase
MLFAAGALVAVHNLYTVSAPNARWGISLPMAALAALWTYDLNLYTINYLTQTVSVELIQMRGFAMTLLAPIFIAAALRNSELRLRLSRTVAFQSVSLFVIGGYLIAMVLLNTLIELIGGDYARLAQSSVIFAMTIIALLVLPSGQFRAWFKVKLAKNFFQHRYDYRSEWMRFADTIGFSGHDTTFHERVIKSMADILECPSGLLLTPSSSGQLMLQARWNWSSADVPSNPGTQYMVEFFETTNHIVIMDEARVGKDDRCDPRALPQWLFDEPNAWLIVPLVHFGKLTGIMVLAKPRIAWTIDWEDMDMLRVVSRQLGSYLAEADSQKKLIEGQQFDQFNRRFAFVMHDIKNLVSQLSILSQINQNLEMIWLILCNLLLER